MGDVTTDARAAPGIAFSGGAAWGAFAQVEIGRWAQRSDITPRAMRVLFAAMGRIDSAGHARWAPGELALVLGSVEQMTGVIVPAARSAVSDAIAVAKRLGMVADDSTARCLVLPDTAFQKARGPVIRCPVHG